MSESLCAALYEPNWPRVEWLLKSWEHISQISKCLMNSSQWETAKIQFPFLLGLCHQLQFNLDKKHQLPDHRTNRYFLGKYVSPIFLFSCFPLFLSHQFQDFFFHVVDEEKVNTISIL